MGAGSPKFRIWLVMLAASKKNTMSGNLVLQALAQTVGVVGGGTVLLAFERNQNVAVAHADGRAVAERQVEAAVGNADVVDNGVDLARAESPARISSSISAKISSVFSMRVPEGARACSRICPESTVGKKSRPMKTDRPSEPDHEQREAASAPARDGPGTSAAARCTTARIRSKRRLNR